MAKRIRAIEVDAAAQCGHEGKTEEMGEADQVDEISPSDEEAIEYEKLNCRQCMARAALATWDEAKTTVFKADDEVEIPPEEDEAKTTGFEADENGMEEELEEMLRQAEKEEFARPRKAKWEAVRHMEMLSAMERFHNDPEENEDPYNIYSGVCPDCFRAGQGRYPCTHCDSPPNSGSTMFRNIMLRCADCHKRHCEDVVCSRIAAKRRRVATPIRTVTTDGLDDTQLPEDA